MLIDGSLFFAILCCYCLGDYFNCSVGAVNFANTAACAFMLVLFIVRHDHFSLESVEHDKILPVVRIFLGDNLARAEKVAVGDAHTFQQRPYPISNAFKILNYAIHNDIVILVSRIRNAIS